MPIDPSIRLGIRPLQLQTPHEALAQVLQGQRAASEFRTLRQQEADQRAIRQVLVETGGDVEGTLPRLRTINRTAALALETSTAQRQE
jgi:hypothetical protein